MSLGAALPNPNAGQVVAEAWERALTLTGYGRRPLTVGWWKGQAFVRLWNYRTGETDWRRHPSRDVKPGAEPKPKPCPAFSETGLMAWLAQ